jgi:hypothetical protein
MQIEREKRIAQKSPFVPHASYESLVARGISEGHGDQIYGIQTGSFQMVSSRPRENEIRKRKFVK